MAFGQESPFGSNLKISVNKDFYISGALGPLSMTKKATDFPNDADGLIGESGGNDFYLGGPLNTTSYMLFF